MIKKINILSLFFMFIFFVSCNEKQNNNNIKSQEKKVEQSKIKISKKDCSDVHWSHHSGEDGPENWKNLCDGFSDCGGKNQSPIDIITKNVKESKDLSAPIFNYGKSKVDIINNSHTVQFNVSGDNKAKLNGKDYKLLQFHYHVLSEHTINGQHFPLEVHFVHKNSDTDYAVLGIMFKEGKENPLLKKYLDNFPSKEGEYKSNDEIDLLSLLPKNKTYYFYKGSLTTPPCSEIVNWYVFKHPVEASKTQIEKLSKILNNNYRTVQPLNQREIKMYKE